VQKFKKNVFSVLVFVLVKKTLKPLSILGINKILLELICRSSLVVYVYKLLTASIVFIASNKDDF